MCWADDDCVGHIARYEEIILYGLGFVDFAVQSQAPDGELKNIEVLHTFSS